MDQQETQSLLVGIIIDVSSSMKRNWKNPNGKTMPRIEVIKEAFNKRVNWEHVKTSDTKIDVFCIGMGFQSPMKWNKVVLDSIGGEKLAETGMLDWKQADIVCDLLALSEILPTSHELQKFRDELDQKWRRLTSAIFQAAEIDEAIHEQLVTFIEEEIKASAIKSLYSDWRYILLNRLPNSTTDYGKIKKLLQKLQMRLKSHVERRETSIRDTSKTSAKAYFERVVDETAKDFSRDQEVYVGIVITIIESFTREYVTTVIRALSLGFDIPELIDSLEEVQVTNIAQSIHGELATRIQKKTALAWKVNQVKLYLSSKKVGGKLRPKKEAIKALTETAIQQKVWVILKPLIRDTILNQFIKEFELQAADSLPYWIRLASTREVTRPFQDIPVIFPDTLENKIYTDEAMFGVTPLGPAIDRAAIRLLDKSYESRRKVLIIISDGEFEDRESILISGGLLKKRGVHILSCVVSNIDLGGKLFKKSHSSWPKGIQLMFDIATDGSEYERLGTTTAALSAKYDGRLFLQINHPNLLEDFLSEIFETDSKYGR